MGPCQGPRSKPAAWPAAAPRHRAPWGQSPQTGRRPQGLGGHPAGSSGASLVLPQVNILIRCSVSRTAQKPALGKSSSLASLHPSLSLLFSFCYCVVVLPFLTFKLRVGISEVVRLPSPGKWGGEQERLRTAGSHSRAQRDLGRHRINQEDVAFRLVPFLPGR